MNKINLIIHTLYSLKTNNGENLVINEEKILEKYRLAPQPKSGIAIKLLSIIGGVASSLFFLGFLMLAGIYDSEAALFILGLVFVGGSIAVNTRFRNLVIDTASISFYIIGLCLITFGMGIFHFNENGMFVGLIVIAILTLIILQNYIFAFISVLVINGSLLGLIIVNHVSNSLHVLISIQVFATLYFFIHEARVLRAGIMIANLYEAVRTATVLSLLVGLALVDKGGFLRTSIWFTLVTSVSIMIAAIYLAHHFTLALKVQNNKDKILIYSIATLMFLPTFLAPSIGGALLILLLSFFANHRGGIVVGICALLYFICQSYYDLNLSLLVKSYILIGSGILFLLIYMITINKLRTHAKN